jgi:outer membrane immunogenic protein
MALPRVVTCALVGIGLFVPTSSAGADGFAHWTGCYVGANLGGGWSDKGILDASPTPRDSHTNSGVTGGGQIGCDLQMQSWVLGIEGMWNAASIDGEGADLANPVLTWNSESSWFATLGGRIGYAVQAQTLIYAKGGVAWVRDHNYLFSPFGGNQSTPDQTLSGWMAGGGAEYKVDPSWSLFVEYNYIGLGNKTELFTRDSDFETFPYKVESDLQMVLFGINYRFGGAN